MQVSPKHLYDEFKRYYDDERCQWAPRNANRIFQFAFSNVYPNYRELMSQEEFLGVVYETLGFSGPSSPGLFQKFDPRFLHSGNWWTSILTNSFSEVTRCHFLA